MEMKYRVDTESDFREFADYEKAVCFYEKQKNKMLCEEVTEESYIELHYSDDKFEDYQLMKHARIVIDEERGNPRDDGHDFDFYAKWVECGGEESKQ